MRRIDLAPHDTLFFRDNRPGSAGEPMTARFAMPSVLFGALRSHFLRTGEVDVDAYGKGRLPEVEAIIGEPSPDPRNGTFRILGPFLARGPAPGQRVLFLPSPALLFAFADDPQARLKAALPSQAATPPMWDVAEPGLGPVAVPRGERAELVNGWLSLDQWKGLIEQLTPNPALRRCDLLDNEAFFTVEARMGHRRNPHTLRPEDAQLFRTDHFRFHDGNGSGALAVLADGLGDDNKRWQGAVLLGGERRQASATIRQWSSPFDPALRDRVAGKLGKKGRAFVTLASPACFASGWFPKLSALGDSRLVGAAVPAPEPVAGWDLAKKRHKPLRLFTPAGATYFYQGVSEKAFTTLWDDYQLNKSVSDFGAHAGFGAAIVGAWRSEG